MNTSNRRDEFVSKDPDFGASKCLVSVMAEARLQRTIWHSTISICLEKTLNPNAYTFHVKKQLQKGHNKAMSLTQATDTFEGQIYKEIS